MRRPSPPTIGLQRTSRRWRAAAEAGSFGVRGAVLLMISLCGVGCASTARPAVEVKSSEQDYGVRAYDQKGVDTLFAKEQPAIAEARKSYPSAKARYLAGLPAGEHFFVTTRLYDPDRRVEQLFVLVDKITGDIIDGRISSHVDILKSYRQGQIIRVPEKEVLDWTILHADGREEGNFIGKWLDSIPKSDK